MAVSLSDDPVAGPNAVTGALLRIMARLRLVRWVRHASRGAFAGTIVSLIAVIVAHFDLLPEWLPLEVVIAVPVLLGIAAGTATAFARPISQMDAARLAEARLGLKERLSSALEFEKAAPNADPEAADSPAIRQLNTGSCCAL